MCVYVRACSRSSVGADVELGYNETVTAQVAQEAQQQVDSYLNDNGWKFVATDGTVYPVMFSPEAIVDNTTG